MTAEVGWRHHAVKLDASPDFLNHSAIALRGMMNLFPSRIDGILPCRSAV